AGRGRFGLTGTGRRHKKYPDTRELSGMSGGISAAHSVRGAECRCVVGVYYPGLSGQGGHIMLRVRSGVVELRAVRTSAAISEGRSVRSSPVVAVTAAPSSTSLLV